MRKPFSFATLVCLPLIACGSSDSNSKTVTVADAKTYKDAPVTEVTCKAPASYTTNLGTSIYAGDSPATGSSDHYQEIQGELAYTGSGTSGSDTVDVLALYLFQDSGGSGAFGSGIKAGSYTIDPTTDSSIFLLLWPALPGNTTTLSSDYLANEQYLAFSGSLTLTSEGGSGSAIAGTLESIDYIHVTESNNTYTAADDDGSGNPCESTIAQTSFSSTLKYIAPSFQGTGGAPIGPIPSRPSLVLTRRHN